MFLTLIVVIGSWLIFLMFLYVFVKGLLSAVTVNFKICVRIPCGLLCKFSFLLFDFKWSVFVWLLSSIYFLCLLQRFCVTFIIWLYVITILIQFSLRSLSLSHARFLHSDFCSSYISSLFGFFKFLHCSRFQSTTPVTTSDKNKITNRKNSNPLHPVFVQQRRKLW